MQSLREKPKLGRRLQFLILLETKKGTLIKNSMSRLNMALDHVIWEP